MNEITIKQAQQDVDHWIKTVGVRYFTELTNLGMLMEEVGELSRLMVRIYGEQSFKESDQGKELGDEMADVYSSVWPIKQELILPQHYKRILKKRI